MKTKSFVVCRSMSQPNCNDWRVFKSSPSLAYAEATNYLLVVRYRKIEFFLHYVPLSLPSVALRTPKSKIVSRYSQVETCSCSEGFPSRSNMHTQDSFDFYCDFSFFFVLKTIKLRRRYVIQDPSFASGQFGNKFSRTCVSLYRKLLVTLLPNIT
ncbi:hypothetical protein AVEN_155076-1 [Araneus ventricosus]|uniref:Uncharacterized protein n=1 Tax=Araneus ventricosus TaxID=182803 RepID=A0A4Y2A8S8_ARAVE|nr:hypothetical protein AVEN_155076-1 [Araneus ventricosus]